MRRHVFLFAIALMVLGAAAVIADEAVLIDFSALTADIIPDPIDESKLTQNRGTMMDFSTVAGASYTDEQKAQMRVSLAIENWDVLLASSSRVGMNEALSYTREAQVDAEAAKYPGSTVLGIRVRFPLEPFNSWARIQPPFDIPAFEPKADIDDNGAITERTNEQGTDPANAHLTRFEGVYDSEARMARALGVVKNVGTIKAVQVSVRGLQFPHGLSVILKDDQGEERTMFMGYLNFDGWRELRWDNPQYITDVRNRELRISPLYPKATPFVKIAGFLITRDAAHPGGDFITYIKDVKILYDKAVLEPLRDIDDEALWGIVGKREEDRKRTESLRFGANQVLRFIERQKQETRSDFSE